ncbi:carbon storage regulator [Amphritea sp.]|uniref:carbon storage regulator n=1 Tax=Amphritea sp. TaxID=1872502 RepID=UPI0025BEDAB8|nr:carbon storage regulator [Amphritea sp.]
MSLVLTRKPSESITLFTADDEPITITVANVNGQQVKLSFEAPDNIDILRNELLDFDDKALK